MATSGKISLSLWERAGVRGLSRIAASNPSHLDRQDARLRNATLPRGNRRVSTPDPRFCHGGPWRSGLGVRSSDDADGVFGLRVFGICARAA